MMFTTEVTIPAALPHQDAIVQSPARFKVVRAGRRGGKTVLAELCAVAGHGPTLPHDGLPMYKGIAHDLDVVWVARDYTQSKIMWHEFVEPRFRNKEGVRVNGGEMTVTLRGGGTLFIVSAENIASVRGIGKRLGGVVVEEAAWLALGSALRDVILPALMDNEGWLLLISTTNAGPDGGKGEDGEPQVPSYFNVICQEILDGKRSSEWAHFHFTARDNPKISERAFTSLVAEYGSAESPSLKQEVYAELLVAGAGLAFPEWLDALHVVPTREPPRHWKYAAAMDWGYRQGSYGLYALGPDGEIEKVWEYYGDTTVDGKPDRGLRQKHAKQAAKDIAAASRHFPRPEYIAADTQMWSEVGTAETLAEEFREGLNEAFGDHAPPLIEMRHDAKSRKPKKNLVHRYLAYKAEPDGTVQPWNRPRLRFQQRCVHTIRTMKALPLDPNKPDDVDTTAEDHAYDETAFALASRPPLAEKRPERIDQDNQHPGLDYEHKRVRSFTEEPDPLEYRVPVEWRVPR